METTNIALATATVLASSTPAIKQTPEWISYVVDLIFIILFLYILFFVKPQETTEEPLSEEEKPNPLEQILKTDNDEENIESKSEKTKESE